MTNFQVLHDFLNGSSNVRILILDNNNIQFCCQYEEYFPVDEIYQKYDLIEYTGERNQPVRRLVPTVPDRGFNDSGTEPISIYL